MQFHDEAKAIAQRLLQALPDLGEHRESYVDALSRIGGDAAAAQLSDVAKSLDGLGVFFRKAGRIAEAEGAFQSSLFIYRELAELDSAAYLMDYVSSRCNYAGLFEEAEENLRIADSVTRNYAE